MDSFIRNRIWDKARVMLAPRGYNPSPKMLVLALVCDAPFDIIKLLMAKDKYWYQRTKQENPVMEAASRHRWDVVELFLSYRVKRMGRKFSGFFQYPVICDCPLRILYLVVEHPCVNIHYRLLFLVYHSKRIPDLHAHIRQLIHQGANVDFKGVLAFLFRPSPTRYISQGIIFTPLEITMYTSDIEMARYLLQMGAKVGNMVQFNFPRKSEFCAILAFVPFCVAVIGARRLPRDLVRLVGPYLI